MRIAAEEPAILRSSQFLRYTMTALTVLAVAQGVQGTPPFRWRSAPQPAFKAGERLVFNLGWKAASAGTHTPLPVFITIAENILLIYVAVHLTAFRLGQESFILSGETHFRWPWQRRTRSVQSKSN